MSAPLILGCLWALASALVALLPMRRQYLPGSILLGAAPLLLIWIGARHGWIPVALATAALLSMFRHPLMYFARRGLGLPVERPDQPHVNPTRGKDAA